MDSKPTHRDDLRPQTPFITGSRAVSFQHFHETDHVTDHAIVEDIVAA
ncbi:MULTISPECIES: hypothetical protein [unclassified Rhizobium]|nr:MULTISPECIES: hypothetical protein [unclassified Rhizobium]